MKKKQLDKLYIGVILGCVGTVIGFFIAYLILFQLYRTSSLPAVWARMQVNNDLTSKLISLSIMFNLVFLYGFLRYEMYKATRGIILSTFIFGVFIIYLKYIA